MDVRVGLKRDLWDAMSDLDEFGDFESIDLVWEVLGEMSSLEWGEAVWALWTMESVALSLPHLVELDDDVWFRAVRELMDAFEAFILST